MKGILRIIAVDKNTIIIYLEIYFTFAKAIINVHIKLNNCYETVLQLGNIISKYQLVIIIS